MKARGWIAARRELLDAATPGPWEAGETQHFHDPWHHARYAEVEPSIAAGCEPEDAVAIADAHTALPAALTALEAVLARHYEGDSSQGYAPNGDYVDLGPCCETCGTNGEYGIPWPCPTVTAIAGALGVEP